MYSLWLQRTLSCSPNKETTPRYGTPYCVITCAIRSSRCVTGGRFSHAFPGGPVIHLSKVILCLAQREKVITRSADSRLFTKSCPPSRSRRTTDLRQIKETTHRDAHTHSRTQLQEMTTPALHAHCMIDNDAKDIPTRK